MEIKSNQYEGEIFLDNKKVKVKKNTKKYIDHAFFEKKNHNVECIPVVQEKRGNYRTNWPYFKIKFR